MTESIQSAAPVVEAKVSIPRTRARTYVPDGLQGWWGTPDTRLRCSADHKVVFQTEHSAQYAANKARHRGTPMKAYRGKCGHWHTSRIRP